MTEIPEEAVSKVATVLHAQDCGGEDCSHVSRDVYLRDAREVIAAALPHLQPSEAEQKALAETAGEYGRVLGLEEAAKVADGLAAGVVNPEKLYNEAFIHACAVVARAIRELA